MLLYKLKESLSLSWMQREDTVYISTFRVLCVYKWTAMHLIEADIHV